MAGQAQDTESGLNPLMKLCVEAVIESKAQTAALQLKFDAHFELFWKIWFSHNLL